MSRHWFDLVGEPPAGAVASAPAVALDGAAAGHLAIWTGRDRPTPGARRIDARLVDPAGAAAEVSLVRPPPGVRRRSTASPSSTRAGARSPSRPSTP